MCQWFAETYNSLRFFSGDWFAGDTAVSRKTLSFFLYNINDVINLPE